jgi:hypothetical protein
MGVGMSWEYGSRTRCPRGRHRVQPSAMHLDCEHDFQTRMHRLPRTHDVMLSVVIRSLPDKRPTPLLPLRTRSVASFGPSRVRVNRACWLDTASRRRRDGRERRPNRAVFDSYRILTERRPGALYAPPDHPQDCRHTKGLVRLKRPDEEAPEELRPSVQSELAACRRICTDSTDSQRGKIN